MAASHGIRLRVGVIGLGRLWEARHKPAFARLSDRFRVTAVYDQVARRAANEAAQLGCAATVGVAELVNRPDVDVIYLLTPQWFGSYAIELACAANKPIYCALPIAADPPALEAAAALIKATQTRFMPELARRFYPVTLRLKELIATSLGKPRLVLGQSRLYGFDRYGRPGPSTQNAPVPLAIDPGGYLLDWCRFIFEGAPIALQGFGGLVLADRPDHAEHPRNHADDDFESFHAVFAEGGIAQIAIARFNPKTLGDAIKFLPPSGFQVFTEHGAALLEMPDRIEWRDAQGNHEERLPLEPTVGEMLNDQFHRMVRGEHSLAPTLDDALALTRQIDVLNRSRAERRTIDLTDTSMSL